MMIRRILKRIRWLNQLYIKIRWKERRVSYGQENPEKIFYVIRRATSQVGLFSYVMTNLGHIKYALEHGYIPVIDMQNNKNTYLEEKEVGIINAWEYYFKQPCGYGLRDIAKSKNIILSDGLISGVISFPGSEIACHDEALAVWKQIADNTIFVRDEIQSEAEHMAKMMFGGKRILGVLARGTDYTESKPRKHPVQPEVEQLIEKCREVMYLHKCEKIYLTTEDAKIFKKFEECFSEELISMPVNRYQLKSGENINSVIHSHNVGKNSINGKEYLISILLLAKCNCLVGGNTGGTQGAMLLSEGYEYKYVFDLGVY